MYSKIKWDGSQVTLCWADRPNAKRNETHELTSSEEPAPEFMAAMRAFLPWILECLGVGGGDLGLDENPGKLEVRGVSRSTGGCGGIVVTALLSTRVASAPMVLNTPFVPEVSETPGGRCLPFEVIDCLEHLDRQARRFHQGERSQGNMFSVLPSREERAQGGTTTVAVDEDVTDAEEAPRPDERASSPTPVSDREIEAARRLDQTETKERLQLRFILFAEAVSPKVAMTEEEVLLHLVRVCPPLSVVEETVVQLGGHSCTLWSTDRQVIRDALDALRLRKKGKKRDDLPKDPRD